MNNTKAPLYLIDAYGLIYRSYFAFMSRPLRNARGENVSALFGFFRFLSSILEKGAPNDEGAPRRMVVAFDSRVPTFRHERYPEYKAKRQKTPEDLHSQVPLVEEALAALGIPRIQVDRFEADDIIATLATRCREEGRRCYILSSDKDLLQLVDDNIFQLRAKKGPGDKGGQELVGPEEVRTEWGVSPERILDVLSLTGDASDNVPGVKGIGNKGATGLVARYGSLDAIYENLSAIGGALGTKLAEGRESALFSRELISLDCKVPLESLDIDRYSIEEINRPACAHILLREGLFQLAKSFDPAVSGSADGSGETAGGAAGRAPEARGAGSAGAADSFAGSAGGSGPADSFGGADGLVRYRVDESLKAEGSYQPIQDLKELQKLLAKARKAAFMALDFECAGLDPHTAPILGFSFAFETGRAWYVPLCSHAAEGDELLGTEPFIEPSKARDALAPLLADLGMTIAAHNARFDYVLTRAWGLPRWKARCFDSMVAAWLLDAERSSISLSSLASDILSLTGLEYKEIVPKNGSFADVPLSKATRYAGEDADFCLRLARVFQNALEDYHQKSLFEDTEMPLLPVLAEMELEGIHLDAAKLVSYSAELEGQLAAIEKEIYELVGHEFNIASTKQLQEVLFVERRLKPGKKTKTGYSTDVGVLEELAREDPVPARILRHRSLAKLKSTYVDTLPLLCDSAGRVHPTFVQTGTATGRLSCRDPNLQNIPIRDEEGRRIRSAFTASAGKVLVSADYSQIELVVLAHLSGDKALCEAFASGIDVHRRTAGLIFDCADDEVTAEQRRIAKTINFGVMYGMSAFRLSNELGIPRTRAQEFIDRYFATYSGIRAYMEQLVAESFERGWATTLLGRRRPIPAIRSSNKTERAAAERVAVNTPIQGSAADIVKLAMLKLDAARLPKSARMLLQVHDELIFEVEEGEADELAAIVKREMESAVTLSVPLRASVEIGASWGDVH